MILKFNDIDVWHSYYLDKKIIYRKSKAEHEYDEIIGMG